MMKNTVVEWQWRIAGWVGVVATIVAARIAMAANPSTTALLLAISIAPGIGITLLARGARSSRVARILYSVETKDGQS